jgi:hypothetical protein
MKYTITESQYRKIILNYLNSVASDFVFEDDEEARDNWVDVYTSDGLEFGSVWFRNEQNTSLNMISEGCDMELSLDERFIQEFEQTIPIIMPKVFSQVLLEYFNSEFPYAAGEDDPNGNLVDKTYHFNTKDK